MKKTLTSQQRAAMEPVLQFVDDEMARIVAEITAAPRKRQVRRRKPQKSVRLSSAA